MTVDTAMFERQVALEKTMQAMGKEYYESVVNRAMERGAETMTDYGKKLMKYSVTTVAQGVQDYLEENKTGKGMKGAIASKYIKLVPAEVVAFIAVSRVLDGISGRTPLVNIAVALGQRLEDEVRAEHLELEDKKRYKATTEYLKKTSHYDHKRKVMNYAYNKAGLEWKPWPKEHKVHIGVALVNIVIETTGFAQLTKFHIGKTETAYLTATDKTREFISKENARNPLLNPTYLPCIIPPKPWTNPSDGGYHTKYIPQLDFVKQFNKEYLEELHQITDEMSVVYSAVNTMQNTGWRINNKVLPVLQSFLKSGVAIAKLPRGDDEPRPLCPVCGRPVTDQEIKTKSHPCFIANPEQHKEWKRETAKIHDENAKLWSKRLQVQKTVWIAEMFKTEKAFYYPYQLDFRGRVYAVPHYLTPQSSDVSKGLLEFAEGKPVDTPQAEKWLAVHGANLYGEDKCSLEDRHQWVLENTERILYVADAPDTELWWAEADKPWQFLAWCFEWAGYIREGVNFMSHCCIAMDGSCNGLQHYSAMLRDVEGGKAVNLLPSDKPNDIYGIVADKVVEKLEYIIANDKDDERVVMAHKWVIFGINRKVCKRPVMVLPYGGTQFSCRKYLESALKERVAVNKVADFNRMPETKKPMPFVSDDFLSATSFLADLVWQSILEVVIGAVDVMGWLRKTSSLVSKEELPITWRTPSGFYVNQAYPELKHRRINTKMGDVMYKATLVEDTGMLDKHRQANGIAPNFVHSMDASAMTFAIKYASESGVTSFGMIHDSYGTHAHDSDTLAFALRKAFVDMYSTNDVLENFKKDIEAILSDENLAEMEDLPPRGELDITQVLLSDFFFA